MHRLRGFWQRGFLQSTYTIVVGCAALIALGWVLTFERVQYERGQAIRDAVAQNSNLAIAFEEHTVRSLKAVDQMVLLVLHEYREHGRALDLSKLIRAGVIELGVFIHVDVVDASGASITDPARPNGADRDFFTHHRDAPPGGGMLIGRPATGRVTGRASVHVTRRIDLPDGTFGGVVLAAVDPEYFAAFYRHINLGRDGMVVLVGRDGIVRARQAAQDRSVGHDLKSSPLFESAARSPVGSFVSPGRVDGVPRFISYRTLVDFPLLVVVGTSTEEALAQFRVRELAYYTGMSLGTLLVLLLGLVLHRAQARHQASVAALHEQLDELRRFQAVTVDRELRMQELEARMHALQQRIPA